MHTVNYSLRYTLRQIGLFRMTISSPGSRTLPVHSISLSDGKPNFFTITPIISVIKPSIMMLSVAETAAKCMLQAISKCSARFVAYVGN